MKHQGTGATHAVRRPCSLRRQRANMPLNNEVGMSRFFLCLVTLSWLAASALAQGTKPATTQAVSQAELEKKFADSMSGATLVGKFTEERTPRPRPAEPSEDRYTLKKVQK